ncbi:hypothetical protein [Actinophytocola oryzae]|uniref:Uncharacterized protein n=1 Tax=Actinophytocola oryzae TaxID=502181 RepID=A0A4R7W6F7_9PSEU|nr:hypothetical protein [Actinophytocola oryzae]TDV57609.1 hypothetical protein CLV71_101480 [Actinophytocola oryzae]
MTVNDGLPLNESAAYDAEGHITDPPTELLPANANAPAPGAAPPPPTSPVDATSELPTQALPLGPPAPPPVDTAEGSVEGDLFDDVGDRPS